ncbi:leucyl aminopeptidase [Candidatus Woesearchaeota archaeon]|nr:leucyl aminopeptidase [Candidatus Woesearchaeota archaeon]
MVNVSLNLHLDPNAQVLVYALFNDAFAELERYNQDLAADVMVAKEKRIFSAGFGELYVTQITSLPYYRIIMIGMGERGEFTLEKCRRVIGKATRATRSLKQESFTTNILEQIRLLKSAQSFPTLDTFVQAAVEAVYFANYGFLKYIAEERRSKQTFLRSVSFFVSVRNKEVQQGLRRGEVIGQATNMTRELVFDHAGVITPQHLEKVARTIATKSPKFNITVLNKTDMQRLKMGALLGVSAGSPQPPKMIFLEYNGTAAKNKSRIALVGKGITFDSGGYNLKPTKSIEEMKTDMAGAAAVLGTVWAAAQLNLPLNLVAVIPACENMIGGTAQHPGDIVRAYNGKTIEIGNTDAEGRLVLADAMAYTAEKYKPSVMIDVATLTGACVVALGYYASGLFSAHQELIARLVHAGEQSGDRTWAMPFFDEYQDWMEGSISDLNNISPKGKGGEAGSIMGAVFLKNFVGKTRWAHLDIAGSANWAIEGDYLSRGPTGSGVRILVYYLLNQLANKEGRDHENNY